MHVCIQCNTLSPVFKTYSTKSCLFVFYITIQAFAFLASFMFVAIGVWMVVFLVMQWNQNLDLYIVNPKTIETKETSDPDADTNPVAAKDEPGQLQFTEPVTD